MKISDSISVSGASVRSRIDEISQRLGAIKRLKSSWLPNVESSDSSKLTNHALLGRICV